MQLRHFTYLFLICAISACASPGLDEEPQQEYAIAAGATAGDGIVHVEVGMPLVVESDSLENDTIAIDINLDQIPDLIFYSVNHETDSSSLVGSYIDDQNNSVLIAIEGNGAYQVSTFELDEEINASENDWISPINFPLSAQTIDSNGLVVFGNMNNRTVYIGFQTISNVKVIGWMKVSVESYKKLTIHDYAIKLL